MAEAVRRRALVVTTPGAAGARVNGATLRSDEVTAVLEASGHDVVLTRLADIDRTPGDFDLGVAVSYSCAPAIRSLRRRTRRVWLDAVDSWLLVDGSGLRSGHPTYLLRAVRDASRMLRMPQPDLVTYISAADLATDRGSIRAARRLVLPSQTRAPRTAPQRGHRRVVLAGDWNYAPNQDGLRWFRRQVLPVLERSLPGPGWSVAVYGDGLPPGSGDRLCLLGYAEDAADLYRDGDVHAAPVRFGGGVKRKVLQPLLAGLPVVTTSAGAHGLRATSRMDVCNDAASFAAALAARLTVEDETHPMALSTLLDRDDAGDVLAWMRA